MNDASARGLGSPRRAGLVLAGLACAWLAAGVLGARHLAFQLPKSFAAALSEPSYYALVWTLTTLLGVTAVFAVDRRPREALALERPSLSSLGLASLLAPLVLVVSLYVAWRVALPTIVVELATRGKQAVNAAASTANRAARKPNVTTIVVWSVFITPLAEELLFRGALWSALRRLFARDGAAAPPSLAPELVVRSRVLDLTRALASFARDGGLPTLLVALLFAWLHVEGEGGVAQLAFVQTALLGLALGLARARSGSLAAPIVMHACFNALTLAQKRGLLRGDVWPAPLPIPSKLWVIAAVGALLSTVFVVARRLARPVELGLPPEG